MANEEQPEQIQVPLVWTGAEDVPILFGNSFVCQFDADLSAFIITVGQVTPPALLGPPEALAEQARQIEFVPVRVIARLAVTPSRMNELIQVLHANVDQREQASKLRPGDPRDE
jgi:hypothetical protein